MDDRFNTISGWVLFAGIVALGSSIVAGEIFHGGRPDKMGYPIEGVEQEGDGAEAEQPIAVFLATADAGRGEQVFKKCVACHNVDPGGSNALGPALYGVMGNPVGAHAGYAFSDALSSKGGTWDWETMSEWLRSPRAFAPGTKMTFAGLGNPQDRADVMLFLNSRDPSPLTVPDPPADEPGLAPEGSPTVGGDSPNAAATGEVTAGPQRAQDEPVLDASAADSDPQGGGPAARQD